METSNFKATYTRVLHADPKSNETYIKIPIASLDELGYLHQAMIDALYWMGQATNGEADQGELHNSLYWFARILRCSYPQDELEGLTALLENWEKQS